MSFEKAVEHGAYGLRVMHIKVRPGRGGEKTVDDSSLACCEVFLKFSFINLVHL